MNQSPRKRAREKAKAAKSGPKVRKKSANRPPRENGDTARANPAPSTRSSTPVADPVKPKPSALAKPEKPGKVPPPRKFSRSLPFTIVFQDRDFVVIEKPAGLLTVPFTGGHARNLLDLLRKHFEREHVNPQVVHRIDRYTSGLVLFAKNPRARDALVEQFRAHSPGRHYLAIVHGALSPAEGKLSHALKRNTANFKQHTTTKADKAGTPARLAYKTLEVWREGSLVEVQLDTGLKNQIRVQLAAVGHPIIGDQQYGIATALDARIGRQSLHAASLSFRHPSGGAVQKFESPLPADMQSLLRFLARPNKKAP